MAIITVTGAAQFTAALSSARAGDTLRLNPGDYGALNLDGNRTPALKFAGDVTVTSAVPGDPAVFPDLTVRAVNNLNFENIDFTGSGATSGDLVTITQSRGITINNSDLTGYSIGGNQNGLSVTNSSDIQISNSELADFYYGASIRTTDNLRVLNNDVHSMDFDGLRFAQVTNTHDPGQPPARHGRDRGRRPPRHDPVLDRRRPPRRRPTSRSAATPSTSATGR